ncbi:hypothetical protein [Yoonia sp. 2307UL14-13]|uniref:hypothetical protein n=1 Tax=Yoonia sp. 2307UL14-13 TaxID=3126506 RepID=UPI0030A717F9
MAEFDPEVYDMVCDVLTGEFGISPHRTGPDVEMINLDLDYQEYDRLYVVLSERTGVSLQEISATMPVINCGESENAMQSLRNIAPFSVFAADYLNRCDIRAERETIGSIAATFTAGKYVRSGLLFPLTLPPHSRAHVLIKLVVVPLLVVVGLPVAYTMWPCNPFAWYCGWTMDGRLGDVIGFLVVSSIIFTSGTLWPGLQALRRRRARFRRRGVGD